MKDYRCMKCGSLVFYNIKKKSFYCSLAVSSNGKYCQVGGWGAEGADDDILIAIEQEKKYKIKKNINKVRE